MKKTKRTSAADSVLTDTHQQLTLGKNLEDIKRAVVLLDWIIKPLPDIRGVCVEGQKLGMNDYWHSAAIVKAVRPTVVVTATGSLYKLHGKMNKLCTVDNGFSEDVADAFARGFPSNWKQIIQEFYKQLEDSISIVAECSPLKGRKVQHKFVNVARKRKSPIPSHQMMEIVNHVQNSIWTPAGLVKQKLSTNDVTVTRSGRVSLPPLARWTGQCYRSVPDTDDIEVTCQTECAQKALYQTTAQLLQLPKRSLRMINNTSMSKSLCLPEYSMTQLADSKCSRSVLVLDKIGEGLPISAKEGRTGKPSQQNQHVRVNGCIAGSNKVTAGISSQTRVTIAAKRRTVAMDTDTKLSAVAMDTDTRLSAVAMDTDTRLPTHATNRFRQQYLVKTVGQPDTATHAMSTRSHRRPLTKVTLHRDLSVALRRDLAVDLSSQKVNTTSQSHKLIQSLKESLNSRPDNQQVKTTSIAARKTRSSSNSRRVLDSTLTHSLDHGETRLRDRSEKRQSSKSRAKRQPQVGVSTRRSRRLKTDASTDLNSVTDDGKLNSDIPGPVPGQVRPAAVQAGTDVSTSSGSKQILTASRLKRTTKRKHAPDEDIIGGSIMMADRKLAKKRKVMDNASAVDVCWSQAEKALLHRALKEVNGADASYWETIATMVATRSQHECQEFYKRYLEEKVSTKPHRKASNTSRKHQDTKSRKKGEPIRGGKGTLKRKQDLREFLVEQNEGYEDNLFDGSPFVNRQKVSSLFTVNADKHDSEIFGDNHNCITPIAGTSALSTPGTFLRAKMVSVKKTPQSNQAAMLDDTPISINRRKADQYIKAFIDRNKAAATRPAVALNNSSLLDTSHLPVKSLFSPMVQPSIIIDHLNDTAEEEEEEGEETSPYMYYWNDES